MIFQKYNSKIPNVNFFIGDNRVDITKEYTYLALKLNPNGKFSEKALHALYKIRRKLTSISYHQN